MPYAVSLFDLGGEFALPGCFDVLFPWGFYLLLRFLVTCRLLRTFDPKHRASFHNSCWHSFSPQRMIDLVPIARRPSASARLWLSAAAAALALPPSPLILPL